MSHGLFQAFQVCTHNSSHKQTERRDREISLFFFFLFSFQLVGSGAYPLPAPGSGGEAVGVSGLLNSGQGGSRAAIALPVDEDAAIRFQDQLVTLDLQYERKSV